MCDHAVVYLLEGAPLARQRSTGVATSAAAHLLSIAVLAWTTTRVVVPAQSTAPHRSSIVVFTTPALPGSGPRTPSDPATLDKHSETLGLQIDAQHDL